MQVWASSRFFPACVLHVQSESSETRAICNFANGLKPGPTGTMTDCPEKINQSVNCECFGADFTALHLINLLDGAELAVLRNSSKIDRMLDDFNPVDFRSIRSYKNRHHRCDSVKIVWCHNKKRTSTSLCISRINWICWQPG